MFWFCFRSEMSREAAITYPLPPNSW
ncbi:MAG: hypothetical protein ACK444_03330 [Flavobacteriales bacterium]